MSPKMHHGMPTVRGRAISVDENGFPRLEDIWLAAGFHKSKSPNKWLELKYITPMLEALLKKKTGKSSGWSKLDFQQVHYRKKGQGGGIYADVRLALAYAEFLNPKIAIEVREIFLRYKASDPTLADEILHEASAASNEWVARRALSRAVRLGYTHTLKTHGVERRQDFARCTNATYQGLFGKTAKAIKSERGVSNTRDGLDLRELAYVMAAEALSSERIEQENCDGPHACHQATHRSASRIRDAIATDRKDRIAGQKTLL